MNTTNEVDNVGYVFKVSSGTVMVPAGSLETRFAASLNARRRKRLVSLKSLKNVVTVSGDVKIGSAAVGYLKSLCHRAPTGRAIFYRQDIGRLSPRPVREVLAGADLLLNEMEANLANLATEYGVSVDLRGHQAKLFGITIDEVSATAPGHGPRWSGFITGIRLSDDPSVYTALSSFGLLDLIRHDPVDGREIDRSDVRGHDRLATANAGELRFFQQVHDLRPLMSGLAKLRDLLRTTRDEEVVTMCIPRGQMREQMERSYQITFGRSLEEMGIWPEPTT